MSHPFEQNPSRSLSWSVQSSNSMPTRPIPLKLLVQVRPLSSVPTILAEGLHVAICHSLAPNTVKKKKKLGVTLAFTRVSHLQLQATHTTRQAGSSPGSISFTSRCTWYDLLPSPTFPSSRPVPQLFWRRGGGVGGGGGTKNPESRSDADLRRAAVNHMYYFCCCLFCFCSVPQNTYGLKPKMQKTTLRRTPQLLLTGWSGERKEKSRRRRRRKDFFEG